MTKKYILPILILLVLIICFIVLICTQKQKDAWPLEALVNQTYASVAYVQSDTGKKESIDSLINKYQNFELTKCTDSKMNDAATISVVKLLDAQGACVGTAKKLSYISSDNKHNLTKHLCIEVEYKGEIQRYKYLKNGKNVCDYQIPNI